MRVSERELRPGRTRRGRTHGSLFLFDGGTPGALLDHTAARAELYGQCFAALWAGYQRAVGDVTGDCLADVASEGGHLDLGDGANRGAIFVLSELRRVRGQLAVEKASAAVIFGEEAYDELKVPAYVGDLNLDGVDELVVSARRVGEEGRVYVFLGPVSGMLNAADADLVIEGGGPSGIFGSDLRGAGDLDGDGVPDLLVGAYFSEVSGQDDAGSVYVFSGADLLAQM